MGHCSTTAPGTARHAPAEIASATCRGTSVPLKADGATRTTQSSCITQRTMHYAAHMPIMVGCISRRDRRRSEGTLLASDVGAESFVSLASGSRAHDVEQAITPQGQLWGVCF